MRSADNICGIGSGDIGDSLIFRRSAWKKGGKKNSSALFSNAVISIPEFTLTMKNRHFWVGVPNAGRKWRSAYRRMVLPRDFFKPIDFICFFCGMIYFQFKWPK